MRLPVNPEILRLAWASLNAHRLRGGLTILGIVIGITSVTAMVSLVEGLNRSVQGQLANLGSDVIRIRRFDTAVVVGELPDSLRNRRHFTQEDAQAIRESAPSVLAVTTYSRTQETLRYRDRDSRLTDVTGVDRDYLRVNSASLGEGRPFTDPEIRGGARVVLVGSEVAEELFPGVDPVGREINIRDQRFGVVGVLAERGSFLGQSLDRQVIIPLEALERYFAGPRNRLRLSARPVTPDRVDRAKEEIIESLRRTRGLRPADDNDFALMTQENLLGLYRQITGAFFVVVVAIASVALLVGGIGVMNIMLVSVTERTREIGIRKALGARRRQILLQFLAEAVVLTGAGGVLGLLLGLGVGVLVNAVTPLPAYVPPWAYAAAVAVSSGVGLFFGFWPAVRASRLHPVDALRYE
jgi:putative ABC transport system permease protein